ncbi:MAG: hypothetical protein ACJ75R_09095 [Solirubrobacterales bacterium]
MSTFTDEQLDAAVEALADPERFREAESIVGRTAPKLQRILGQALESGGWFADSHESEVAKATEIDDPAERRAAVLTLLAEETRLGMMVGVAVGWALAGELEAGAPEG